MALVVIPVTRIIAAAAALDKVDPNHELKDDVNEALRLSAVQNGTAGSVTTTTALAARVDELLDSPSPALPHFVSPPLPVSQTPSSDIDELDTYDS